MSLWLCWLLAAGVSVAPALALGQEKGFEHHFSAGAVERYRVRLIVRSELEGEQSATRDGVTFAQKFTRASAGEPAGVAAPRAGRVQLAPRFTPGQTLRYQVDLRTNSESHSAGPIENPEAAVQLQLSVSAVVRLDVLEAQPEASSRGGQSARLRATYERLSATVRTDTFDPQIATLEEQYRRLEGRSVEFTLQADGRVAEVQGLREILPDERAASNVREWLAEFSGVAGLPRKGIQVGQKWSAEQAVTGAPLAGMVWRTRSTYLRDEACQPLTVAKLESATAPAADEMCAVILTDFEMSRPHAPRDPTPEEYRQHGLRTRGRWSSSGQSLSYVSVRTGWVVSVTETGTLEMDVTVAAAETGSQIRYTGRYRSESQITLLPERPDANP